MAKFGLLNMGAAKVAVYTAAGSIATIGVQKTYDYVASSPAREEQRITEEKDDRKKKLEFEVNQLSKQLEEKEKSLKTREAVLAKQKAPLKEERSAVSQLQAAVAVAPEPIEAVVVEQPTPKNEKPQNLQATGQKVELPKNNTPRRPAIFDGGGNKEVSAAPKNKNDASKPSVAFGSSDNVVTIEKGGTSDAETERLRKEVENLRRRLAEKDDSSKEEALRAREERLRERERTLSEMLWKRNMQSKATQTDEVLFETAFGGDDPFDGSNSKKLTNQPGMRESASKRQYSFDNSHPVVINTAEPNRKSSFSKPSRTTLPQKSKKKTDTAASEAGSKVSQMSKEDIETHARNEQRRLAEVIDAGILKKITGKNPKTEEDRNNCALN